MDLMTQVGATRRSVRAVDRDGRPARQVVATRTYPTTVEDLWDALTSPERIPRWFLPVSGVLSPGGRYQLEGNASGVVEACEPPHRLALTWEMGDEVSWVVASLTPQAEQQTLLELVHTAHVPEELWTLFGPGAVGVGWDLALRGLASHLGGQSTPGHEDLTAWAVSPDGLAYVAGANDAWAEANVAAGADPLEAQAAAEQTLAFYSSPMPEAGPGPDGR